MIKSVIFYCISINFICHFRIQQDKSFHCEICNVCLDKRLKGNHQCRPDSGHSESFICLEVSFNQQWSHTINSATPWTMNFLLFQITKFLYQILRLENEWFLLYTIHESLIQKSVDAWCTLYKQDGHRYGSSDIFHQATFIISIRWVETKIGTLL